LGNIEINDKSSIVYNNNTEKYEVEINLDKLAQALNEKTYYKIQVACVSNGNEGYYSNAAIIRKTSQSIISILNIGEDSRCPAECVGDYRTTD
jgi:hypothetical protein